LFRSGLPDNAWVLYKCETLKQNLETVLLASAKELVDFIIINITIVDQNILIE
jgi:hypothetical protein